MRNINRAELNDIIADRLVYVVCNECGQKHLLRFGLKSPVYWCGDTLRELQYGDTVEMK